MLRTDIVALVKGPETGLMSLEFTGYFGCRKSCRNMLFSACLVMELPRLMNKVPWQCLHSSTRMAFGT